MSEIIEKSQQVLQELEEKIRDSRLKKIKSEIVPLTYSPSNKKIPPHAGKNSPKNSLSINMKDHNSDENQLHGLRELIFARREEFNKVCDSLISYTVGKRNTYDAE
jgi:hypothetical protein